MFGKRKQPPSGIEPPRFGIDPQRPRAPSFPIVVRRSEADRYLMEAVARFVETMLNDCDYAPDEIPAPALQIRNCADYLGQVENGGHSQFIGNRLDDIRVVVPSIRAGLVEMAAEKHVAVLDGLTEWMRANPAKIGKQTGFSGGRAPELNELDRQFTAAEAVASIHERAAVWIARWPDLKIVEDDNYDEHIERAKASNPLREQRDIHRSVMAFEHQLSDRKQVAAGLACAGANEFKLKLWQSQKRDVGGQQQSLIQISTDVGHDRIAVVADEYAALHKRVAEGSYELGDRLSYIDAQKIAGAILHARNYRVAVAIDLVLRNIGLSSFRLAVTPISVDPSPSGPVMTVGMVPTPNVVLLAVSGSQGLVLINAKNDRLLARLDPQEIASHAREVDRGRR